MQRIGRGVGRLHRADLGEQVWPEHRQALHLSLLPSASSLRFYSFLSPVPLFKLNTGRAAVAAAAAVAGVWTAAQVREACMSFFPVWVCVHVLQAKYLTPADAHMHAGLTICWEVISIFPNLLIHFKWQKAGDTAREV